jgi:hypothetical protein
MYLREKPVWQHWPITCLGRIQSRGVGKGMARLVVGVLWETCADNSLPGPQLSMESLKKTKVSHVTSGIWETGLSWLWPGNPEWSVVGRTQTRNKSGLNFLIFIGKNEGELAEQEKETGLELTREEFNMSMWWGDMAPNPELRLRGRWEGAQVKSHKCSHTHTHTCTHIHACTHAHVLLCTRTHTHTHTHTQGRQNCPS